MIIDKPLHIPHDLDISLVRAFGKVHEVRAVFVVHSGGLGVQDERDGKEALIVRRVSIRMPWKGVGDLP